MINFNNNKIINKLHKNMGTTSQNIHYPLKGFLMNFNFVIMSLLGLTNFSNCERPIDWQFGFQIPASPAAEGIINFHHDLTFMLVAILGFVGWVLYICVKVWNSVKLNQPIFHFSHAALLEIVWTIFPAIILTIISIPSFVLLYSIDETFGSIFSFKVLGHQWYWSYENIEYDFLLEELRLFHNYVNDEKVPSEAQESFDNFVNKFFRTETFSFDSYALNEADIKNRSERLYAVDHNLKVPVETNTRLLISSSDVLHSWAIPTLGVKLDACPGRLNQTTTFINRPGKFGGQCSEICGLNHGFMPISVTSIDILGDDQEETNESIQNIKEVFTYISQVGTNQE